MRRAKSRDTTAAFERALAHPKAPHYELRLYVTGMTLRSANAIANARDICERHLRGRYELRIIDLFRQPTLAEGEQIFAAPTLVKVLPLPLRRIVGDLSDRERVLVGLDLAEMKRTE